MDAQVRLVHYYLDNDLNENVFFVSERLLASDPKNHTWAHLRSLAALRLGKHALAADFSRLVGVTGEHLGCSYVFAQSCLHLRKHAEGIDALNKARPLWSCRKYGGDRSPPERFCPDSSAVHRLLGKLYMACGEGKTAAACFATALEDNPFMWDAFTDLCHSGTTLRVPNIFRLRKDKPKKGNTVKVAQDEPETLDLPTARNPNRQRKPLNPAPPLTSQSPTHNSESVISATENETKITPRGKRIPQTNPNSGDPAGGQNLPATKKRARAGLNHTPDEASEAPLASSGNKNNNLVAGPSSTSTHSRVPQRRSARLMGRAPAFTSTIDALSSTTGGTSRGNPKRSSKLKEPSRRTERPAPQPKPGSGIQTSGTSADQDANSKVEPLPTTQKSRRGIKAHDTSSSTPPPPPPPPPTNDDQLEPLIELLLKVGGGYYHLSRFQPKECLQAFAALPAEQQATPWVLSKTARAHYELMSYKEAEVVFEALRKLTPAWMEDLELYSTVLWHLKEDVTLAYLAHELTDSHYSSPQTWCAVGNSFAVRNAHCEAIKAFRRACQLNPQIAQSFSLLGYEYMEIEDYGEAAFAFRRALEVDRRHYPAWVGLGRVKERMGEGENALQYYRGAERINSNNAVLMTYIARALQGTGMPGLALAYLQRGLELDPPENILCLIRMHMAGIHIRQDEPDQALRDLRWVEHQAPDEARVHFMLGQAHALSGEKGRGAALKCYTTALSLAPWSEEVKMAMSDLEGRS